SSAHVSRGGCRRYGASGSITPCREKQSPQAVCAGRVSKARRQSGCGQAPSSQGGLMLPIFRTEMFATDVDRQIHWYLTETGLDEVAAVELAQRFAAAVESGSKAGVRALHSAFEFCI